LSTWTRVIFSILSVEIGQTASGLCLLPAGQAWNIILKFLFLTIFLIVLILYCKYRDSDTPWYPFQWKVHRLIEEGAKDKQLFEVIVKDISSDDSKLKSQRTIEKAKEESCCCCNLITDCWETSSKRLKDIKCPEWDLDAIIEWTYKTLKKFFCPKVSLDTIKVVVYYYFSFTIVIVIPYSLASLTTCIQVGDIEILTIQPGVNCQEAEYKAVQVIAITCLSFYFFLLLCYIFIIDIPKAVQDMYKENNYLYKHHPISNTRIWWELVLLVRRALAVTIIFYAQSHRSRMQLLLAIHMVFLVAHIFAWPYASIAVNMTEFLSLSIICIAAIALLDEEPPFTDSQIMGWSLFIVLVVFMMITIALYFGPMLEAFVNRRQQTTGNIHLIQEIWKNLLEPSFNKNNVSILKFLNFSVYFF